MARLENLTRICFPGKNPFDIVSFFYEECSCLLNKVLSLTNEISRPFLKYAQAQGKTYRRMPDRGGLPCQQNMGNLAILENLHTRCTR